MMKKLAVLVAAIAISFAVLSVSVHVGIGTMFEFNANNSGACGGPDIYPCQ